MKNKNKNNDSIRLSILGFPIIKDLDDFAALTHISKERIYKLSKFAELHYKQFDIPKKTGGVRKISQPNKQLKALQAWILHEILYKLNVSSSSKGFQPKSSIIDNVEPHKFANALMTIDLADFFPNIDRKRVYNIFRSIGYNTTISTILTNICVFKNELPQGSPCSPRIANLICWKMDLRIQGFVGKKAITYTRYADDLTFSGLHPINLVKIYPFIKKIIEEEGFIINPDKTRIAGPTRSKRVTGLVISENNFGIGSNIANEIRSKIFHLVMANEQHNESLLYEVYGWLAYLKSVDKSRLSKFYKYIKSLSLKYPKTLISKIKVPGKEIEMNQLKIDNTEEKVSA